MRNLTKTLVAVTLLTSTSVHSLGIGGIKLRSALNQKLNAEIALVTTGDESVDDIKVKLASPVKFDEAGVPWSYFLTKIKFATVAKPDGSVVVKLTSDEVLKEPFLDFLLEVSGPKGTLFREFTVLVDPPATYKQPVIPVAPAPVRDRDSDRFVPRPYVDSVRQPDPYVAKQTDEANQQASPATFAEAEGEYGPVQNNETIWSIANRVKPEEATAQQMVMAIYQANPDAFSRPNINALVAGSILTIPDANAVLRMSPRAAKTAFKHQSKHWGGRENVQKPKPEKSVEAKLDEVKQPTAPEAKVKPETVVTKALPPVKKLKLDPPSEEDITDQDGLATNRHGKSGKETTLASEANAPLTGEDEELRARFDRIEKQLVMMQKMLELKDAQLAALQKHQPNAVQKSLADVDPLLAVAPSQQPQIKDSKPSTNEAAPVTADPKSAIAIAEPEPLVAPKPVVVAPAPAPVQVQTPVNTNSESSFADYYLLAGALGSSLLGALGMVWWRKRKMAQSVEADSMFSSASQISLPENHADLPKVADPASGYVVGTVGESAFLSEFTPSEFDAFETDQTEIDPMSEADVYLAYGRYQQAEELIRQVIADHPDRNDCKLKLLEIYHASHNKTDFNQYVRQLINDGKQADIGFWAKVVELAEEFTPGSGALLAVGDGKSSTGNLAAASSEKLDFDFNSLAGDEKNEPLDASVLGKVALQKATPSVPDELGDVAFMSSDSIFADDSVSEADNGLDFDVSPKVSAERKPLIAESLADEDRLEFNTETDANSLDFDLSALGSEFDVEGDESLELIDEDSMLDFDFDSFGLDSDSTKTQAEPDAQGIKFDLNGFDEVEDNEFKINDLDFSEKMTGLAFEQADEPGLSLDFDLGEEKTLKATKHSSLQLDSSNDLSLSDEFDLKDFNFDAEFTTATPDLEFKSAAPKSVEPLQPSLAEQESEFDFDFDFDFNPNEEATGKQAESGLDLLGVDDLSDGSNNFETKVNLAHAYVDMGDIDAAKVIANDLLTGTAEQKKAGQEILEKIS